MPVHACARASFSLDRPAAQTPQRPTTPPATGRDYSQADWAVGGDGGERESVCEDEGGACEGEGADNGDAEPDDWGWEVPDYGTNFPSARAPWPPRSEAL